MVYDVFMKLIAITGTLGAGKGAVVAYLEEKGFRHYSVREYLSREVTRRGLPPTRDSLRDVGNDLRKQHGAGYIIGELLREARVAGGDAIIESIRAAGEVALLRAEAPECILLAVDAPIKTRYERIVGRGSSTDHVSFEKFKADEEREMAASEPWDMNISACMVAADVRLENGGTLQELQSQTDAILKRISA